MAVAFALAVTYPEAGNIGGGGFMMVWPATGSGVFSAAEKTPDPVCIEYRETAPGGGHADDVPSRREHATPIGRSACPARFAGLGWPIGGTASCRGRSWSRRPFELAAEGFDGRRARGRRRSTGFLRDSPDKEELRRVFGKPRSACWQAGDRLVQPDLAGDAGRIAEAGADAFYTGPIAEQIVAEMQAGGGLITARRPGGVQARVRREPIHGNLPRLRHLRPAAAQLRRHLPGADARRAGAISS